MAVGSLSIGTVLLASCGSAHSPPAGNTTASGQAGPRVTAFKLPAGTFPRFLAFSSARTLWVTEDSGNAIARLDTSGHITQYRIPGRTSNPGDIAKDPDGEMWFAGFGLLGRISGTGQITGWEDTSASFVGFPDAITVGPDGEIWYTNASKINRVTPWGTFGSTNIPAGTGGLQMLGIATGPDGGLWFTEMPWGHGPDAIGRLTTDRHYKRWLLPELRSDPTRITAGPDGAMWFTERAGYRIGRITTHGRISEFPLPPGTSPFDITSGHDGALWFTTDTSVGRITTSGHITLWPVENAQGLVGIAGAPDGSFWLADGRADTVRHFVPPR